MCFIIKGGIAVVLHNLGAVVGRQGDLDRGYRLTKEAVREWQDMGNKELILQGVETIASLLVMEAAARPEFAGAKYRQAALLYGGAEIGRETIKSPLPGGTRREYDAAQVALKEGLGLDRYAALWREGRSLPQETIAARALDAE